MSETTGKQRAIFTKKQLGNVRDCARLNAKERVKRHLGNHGECGGTYQVTGAIARD